MNLQSLKPAKGSTHNSKRVGRGQGSGKGGTSTKGHKGAKSRSGNKTKIGFEGGQMPLQRRTPKRGFKNASRVEFRTINLSALQALADKHSITEFTFETYRKFKLIAAADKIKVLGNGELKSTIQVSGHAFSDKAKEAIEKNGGTATLI